MARNCKLTIGGVLLCACVKPKRSDNSKHFWWVDAHLAAQNCCHVRDLIQYLRSDWDLLTGCHGYCRLSSMQVSCFRARAAKNKNTGSSGRRKTLATCDLGLLISFNQWQPPYRKFVENDRVTATMSTFNDLSYCEDRLYYILVDSLKLS
jgi:hypothetical protein